MEQVKKRVLAGFSGIIIAGWMILGLASCSKTGISSNPKSLNIKYQIVNLSPDLLPVNLYIDLAKINSQPYYFAVPQGYFYLPSTIQPFQIRSAEYTQGTVISYNQNVNAGALYTMYIMGSAAALDTLFTVDTAAVPPQGYGGLRFINISPTATGGLDVSANGTNAFKNIGYKTVTPYINLPAGNYEFQTVATGTTAVLNDKQAVTIQNGTLYTLFAYGYTSRADSAGFNAQVITNK